MTDWADEEIWAPMGECQDPPENKKEKLVGEAYEELSRFAGHIVRYQAGGDRHAEHECKMVFANSLIALIGKAVLNRESEKVDEAMGVVGRVPWHSKKMGKDDEELWIFWLCRMMAGGAKQFIALSGTGKEEEK